MARPVHMRCKAHHLVNVDMQSILEPVDLDSSAYTGTKLCGTIGPASQSVEVLSSLLKAGMSAARVDLTWGPLEFHKKSLENLQLAVQQTRKFCALMVDTLGREVMIRRPFTMDESGWPTHGDKFDIKMGQRVVLTTRSDVEASNDVLPVTYSKFCSMAEPGDIIYIGRYLVCGADSASLYLEVREVGEHDVVCEAKNDALLDGLLTVFHSERSHDEVQNVQNDLPVLSDYDKQCLALLAEDFEVDYLSLSYTRCADDIVEARRTLQALGLGSTKIYAKLETRQALLNLKGILSEADGIIISRGNLGLDCVPEKMALVQKAIVQYCNLVGKPALLTRVVDTMVNTPRPTRAEATDVANAVLDGIDGIVLGAETLRGKFPVETVDTIRNICRQAEKVFDHTYHFEHLMDAAISADDRHSRVAGDSDEEDMALRLSPQQSAVDLPAKALGRNPGSYPSLNMAIRAMTKFGMSSANLANMDPGSPSPRATAGGAKANSYLKKLESIAASAVRSAEKISASLIVVYTHSGKTAELVAKYRPPMPILTVVVPHVTSDSLKWRLEGRHVARQCLLTRGLVPVLAAPRSNGDAVLEEAIRQAAMLGVAAPGSQVVCVQRVHEDFCVKIVAVNEAGDGLMPASAANVNF